MNARLASVLPHRRRRSIAAAAALILGLALGTTAATAQTKEAPAAPGPTAPAPTAPLPPYEVDGFRSAHFGMTEADVRKAIAADFKAADSAIARDLNTIEQTAILTVTVPDLLAEAGPARVSYVFGYTRHRLIYVNVLWAQPKKDGGANSLLGPAAALRNYFLGYSFRAEGLLRDVSLSDGSLLLFQGSDNKGRTVALATGEAVAQGEATAAGPDRQWYLRLSYIENPSQPDVFRIKPGTF